MSRAVADTSVFIARESGRPIDDVSQRETEPWIAATAMSLGIPVVSQDADYDDIPGLDVIRV